MLTDDQVASATLEWWRRFYPETPPSKVEPMVRKWILMTAWGPHMGLDERIKLQNRVSRLIRSRNATAAAQSRARNRKKAKEDAVNARQKILDL